jgi:hypothetical protein
VLHYSNHPFPQDTARGEAVKFYSLCRMVALPGTARIASWHAQKRITGLPNNYAWGSVVEQRTNPIHNETGILNRRLYAAKTGTPSARR